MFRQEGEPIPHSLAQHVIQYWVDGNTDVTYVPRLPEGEQHPWVVRIDSAHWIPANLLVFAPTSELAIDRVMDGLRVCAEKDYHKETDYLANRAHRLLSDISSGKLKIQVSPYPLAVITKVAWASNDTVT